MKKTFLILVAIGILGGSLYFFIKSKQTPDQVPTTGEETGFFRSFFPFSSNKNNADKIENINTENNTEAGNSVADESITPTETEVRLEQVTTYAISGMTVFMAEREIVDPLLSEEGAGGGEPNTRESTPTSSAPQEGNIKIEIVQALRYVEKSTGHIYEYHLDKEVSGKISNSTIPGVYEAIFADNSQSVLYRYIGSLGQIQSYLATLGAEKGRFLAEGIEGVAISPDKNNIFYLSPLANSVTGLNLTVKLGTSKQIFSSDFTEWIPQWVTKQAIFMTTKPSWNIEGSVYALNVSTGAFTKIFGNIKGLTTLANNAGNRIIYNKTTSDGPELGLFIDNSFTSLNLYGLPEKCAWSKDGFTVYCATPNIINTNHLPDMWYQGLVSFNDTIMRIDTRDISKSTIIDTENYAQIDAINMTLSPNEDTLFFMNKKDSTLWKLKL